MMKRLLCLALLLLWGFSVSAQQKVTGTVTSAEDGKPISFASVIVKGTTALANTDDNGKYTITVPADGTTLVFSFFGMKEQEVAIGSQSVIDVVLVPDAITLDETIVVAYGTAKKGTYTGSASVLKADKIANKPVNSFQEALSGQVAGLQFSPQSGQAGSSSSIRIRGTGSMNAGNEPLYVVDGVPVISGDLSQITNVSNNVMATLNPNDIESITVLKDAAASALYGSRAANGVILITTKRGKDGKAKVSLKATLGFTPTYATKNFEKASPKETEEMIYESWYNGYIDDGESEANAKIKAQQKLDYYAPDPGERGYFDWENALFRTGVYQNYDLSVSGGAQGTKYFTSLAYMKETGRSIRNHMDRITGRINLSQQVNEYIEIGANVNLSSTDKRGFSDYQNYQYNDFFMVRSLLLPHQWPWDNDGNPIKSRYNTYVYNPLYYGDLDKRTSEMFRIATSEYIALNIYEGLKFKTTFSYDMTRVDEMWWQSPEFPTQNVGGWVDYYSNKYTKLVSSNILSYDKSIGEHTINVLAGYEAEKNITNHQMTGGQGLSSNTPTSVSTAGARTGGTDRYGHNMLSYLSKLDYNYMNKYFASASFRRDGSSRLGENTRWGNFWSVSASWKPKAEAFLRDVEWLNDLRVRASYGVNGTLPSENYGYMAKYKLTSIYDGATGGVVSNSPDPDLTWETNYTWNFAVEARLFDRFSLNIDIYNRDSKDLLQEVPISSITGFDTILRNFGAMNNKGVDVELRADILKSKDWTWTANINASHFVSKITKLYDGKDVGDGLFIFREGYSPNSFYVREWAGVDTQTGAPQFYKNSTLSDGSLDRAITNKRSEADFVLFDNADPDVYGGLGTSISWKSISLNIGLTYSFGGLSYDNTAGDMQDDGYWNARNLGKKYYNERWTTPGQNATFPRRIIDQDSGSGYISRKLHSTDHIRLKSLTLSYSLPQHIVKKVLISNARVFFSGSNLLTWAKYKDYDPETTARGIKNWTIPLGKTYTFGIELDF